MDLIRPHACTHTHTHTHTKEVCAYMKTAAEESPNTSHLLRLDTCHVTHTHTQTSWIRKYRRMHTHAQAYTHTVTHKLSPEFTQSGNCLTQAVIFRTGVTDRSMKLILELRVCVCVCARFVSVCKSVGLYRRTGASREEVKRFLISRRKKAKNKPRDKSR